MEVVFQCDICLILQDICDSVYQLSAGPSVDGIHYHTKMIPGMNCDFEEEDCQWTTVPNLEQRKVKHYFQPASYHLVSHTYI